MEYEFRTYPISLDGLWAENEDDGDWRSLNELYHQNWELRGISVDGYQLYTGFFQRRADKADSESVLNYEFMTVEVRADGTFAHGASWRDLRGLGINNWQIVSIITENDGKLLAFMERKLPKGTGGLFT